MDIIQKALTIPGFTSEEFLRRLHELARGKRLIVELGAFKGRSTIVLADAVAPDGCVYAVDIWDDSIYGPESFDPEDGYKTIDYLTGYHCFMRYTRGHLDKVLPLVLSSHVAPGYFKPRSVDMLFVDADHAEHMVLRDLQLWEPMCKTDAIICGDDYDMPSVKRPVDAMAMMYGKRVETFAEGKGWKYE